MRAIHVALLLLAIPTCLAAGGCESKAPASSAPAPASTTVKLGAPISASQRVSLASIAKETAKYANTSVTTEGKVTAVCQAMGCWMEIVDAAGEAHVRMSGHKFFIPKTASGRRAIVQGTVLPK